MVSLNNACPAEMKSFGAIEIQNDGVDEKEIDDGRMIIIDVNDNPNIESWAENLILGDRHYDTVMVSFRRGLDAQIQKKRNSAN